MEPDIVKNYLEIVSSLDTEVILLRNMKEESKKLPKIELEYSSNRQ